MRNYKKYVMTMGLVWACSLVLFIAAFYFAITPQLTEKARLVREAAEKQRLYDGAIDAAKEETRKKLTGEIEALKSKLNDYATDFEDSANMSLDISRIAAEKQVTSFSVKTTESAKEQGKAEIKNLRENCIEISFNSDFRQFAAFLNTLERHSPVVFVDRFKVTRGDDGPASNKVDMSLAIFVRKRPQG